MSNNTGGVGSETNINISNDVPPTPPRRLGSSSYAVFSKVGSMSNLTSGTGGVAGALTPSSALKIHHHSSSQHHPRHPQPHHLTSDDHAADGGKHSTSSRSTISRKRSDSYDIIATRGGSDDDSTRSSRSFIAEILKQDSLMDVNLSAREESDNGEDSEDDDDDDDEETFPATIATTDSSEDGGGGESTSTSTTTTTKTTKKKKNKKGKTEKTKSGKSKKKKSSNNDKEETAISQNVDQPLMASISEVFSFGHHGSSGSGGWFWLCSRRTICFITGIICSAMAGIVYPASAFILATIFQSISADPNSTNKQDFLNEIAYTTYLYVGLG